MEEFFVTVEVIDDHEIMDKDSYLNSEEYFQNIRKIAKHGGGFINEDYKVESCEGPVDFYVVTNENKTMEALNPCIIHRRPIQKSIEKFQTINDNCGNNKESKAASKNTYVEETNENKSQKVSESDKNCVKKEMKNSKKHSKSKYIIKAEPHVKDVLMSAVDEPNIEMPVKQKKKTKSRNRDNRFPQPVVKAEPTSTETENKGTEEEILAPKINVEEDSEIHITAKKDKNHKRVSKKERKINSDTVRESSVSVNDKKKRSENECPLKTKKARNSSVSVKNERRSDEESQVKTERVRESSVKYDKKKKHRSENKEDLQGQIKAERKISKKKSKKRRHSELNDSLEHKSEKKRAKFTK